MLRDGLTVWCNGLVDLKTYLQSLPLAQREKFALKCGTTLGHLTNVMYGYKPCGPELAVAIERESLKKVSRRELRGDWHRIWPELVTRKFPAPEAA